MEDLKSFAIFVQVAQRGSLTAAAAELGVTTPTVSKAISRLERELDVRLFERSTRRVSLTVEGRLFLEQVAPALERINHGADLLREAQREPAGTVRLWTNAAIGKDHVLPLLPAFLQRYPRLDAELRFDDQAPDLVMEGYDLAIQHSRSGGAGDILRRLAELPLVLVASPAYLARRGTPQHPQDLAAHECVLLRLFSGEPTVWTLHRTHAGSGEPPIPVTPGGRVVVAGQYDAVLTAALAGLGITVVFRHSVLPYLHRGELQLLLPEWRIKGGTQESNEIYLRYPHREYVPYKVRVLIDCLVQHFEQLEVLQAENRMPD